MTIARTTALIGSALAIALAASAPAQAQGFPNRPITMIVPFAAGGPSDVIGRLMAEHMGRTLGQQVIVENVAGAGGTAARRGGRAQPRCLPKCHRWPRL